MVDHLEGATAVVQTVLPFELAATEETLTAQRGLALFGEYLRALGVCGARLFNALLSAGLSPICNT